MVRASSLHFNAAQSTTPTFTTMVCAHVRLLATLVCCLDLLACGNGADNSTESADLLEPATGQPDAAARMDPSHTTSRESSQGTSGKTLFVTPGIRISVPADLKTEMDAQGLVLRSTDPQMKFYFYWEADAQGTLDKLRQGIDLSDKLLWSNGTTEDLGNGMVAFGSTLRTVATDHIEEGRYNIYATKGPKGTFTAIATIYVLEDAVFARAKERLIALLSSVEHVPETELAAARAREAVDKKERLERRLANKSTAEKDFIASLADKAYSKTDHESYPSQAGTGYYDAYTRYELCASGRMRYTHSSKMNVTSTQHDQDLGYNVETANLRSHDADNYAGTWDVILENGAAVLVIQPDHSAEERYDVQLLRDQLVIGRKALWIRGPGHAEGPRCQ